MDSPDWCVLNVSRKCGLPSECRVPWILLSGCDQSRCIGQECHEPWLPLNRGQWRELKSGLLRVQWLPEGKSLPDVPEEFQDAVLFLGCRRGGVDPVGTAFYLTSSTDWDSEASPPDKIPSNYPTDPERYGWLVTARHVIEGIQESSEDGKVLLMVNGRDGSRIDPYPEYDVANWIQIPNDDSGYLADIALLPFLRPEQFALTPIPIEASLTPSRMAHANINPGADVVYPSLYYQHSGKRRNIPLMRTGTLAAVADYEEPVYIEARSAEAFAHLVEARSNKGASGSPVFVVLPPGRTFRHDDTKGTFLRLSTNTEFYLLGVMITHFGMQDLRDLRELVNLGVSVVLDSSYIWKGIDMAVKDGRGITPEPEIVEAAASIDLIEVEHESFTAQDYLRDLNKATRRFDDESDSEPKRTSE